MSAKKSSTKKLVEPAIQSQPHDEDMKDDVEVHQIVEDTPVPEIKDFIKRSDDEEDEVVPKSTKKASV